MVTGSAHVSMYRKLAIVTASDLIPESHRTFPKALTTLMTLLGIAVLYVAVTLAQV
jgi:hypothetical protein